MHCHTPVGTEAIAQAITRGGSIALIGHPNVGKSALFQKLTGQHVIISNYPGTTIELARAAGRGLAGTVLVDTPGVVTFPPHSEDEQVTARVLLYEPLRAILQVGDAKNLRRTLLLTLQLAELGVTMVLALNMMDEAESCGVCVDHPMLAETLSIPVVPTAAVRGRGVQQVVEALQASRVPQFRLIYPAEIEAALARFCICLAKNPRLEAPVALRALGLSWLSGDPVRESWLQEHLDGQAFQEIASQRETLQLGYPEPNGAPN